MLHIHNKSLHHQRGISLFVVIVLVMLSMLLALWGARTSLFSEMIVGNDADYQRAFEAAQALIQDAEFDIRTEQSDGTPCIPSGQVCRPPGAIVWIPAELKDLGEITANLDAQTEERVLEALRRASTGRTVLSISHRTGAQTGLIIHL